MIAGSFELVVKVQPMRGEGQDRAAVFERDDGGIVIALADGAGGTSHGELAAQAVLDTVEVLARSDAEWGAVLRQLDHDSHRLQGGQTTAVVLRVTLDEIRGASVGDSEAWLVPAGGGVVVLTAQQHAKPLVGSGAQPVAAGTAWRDGATLIVASDGLFRYARPADVARLVAGADLAAAADALVALVRTATGHVPDDIAIVLCRKLVV